MNVLFKNIKQDKIDERFEKYKELIQVINKQVEELGWLGSDKE